MTSSEMRRSDKISIPFIHSIFTLSRCISIPSYPHLTYTDNLFFAAGSPWGSGTLAGGDGSRQPSALELEIATLQGKSFWEHVARVKF
ncbi:hypothetical protein EW146_g10156 [Bondarzewia mesenterica]|uniref:Uncharacterized protein n=1 Tax=Bondarzewia mesenterica TaxID=1095465 RepID=A0A4S4L4N3_9AGAM|nr:hypothetical protein EW146_g10156 [Bondarzewia mesenterica]